MADAVDEFDDDVTQFADEASEAEEEVAADAEEEDFEHSGEEFDDLDDGEEDETKGDALEFGVEDVEGESFMAVKPWLGAIKAPSDWEEPAGLGAMPHKDLELQWVHGYRCRSVYDNVFHSAGGEVVYPAAAIGVIAHADAKTQRFYNEHRDDIISLTLDPTRRIAATGGKASVSDSGRSLNPSVHIWDVETGKPYAVIKNAHKRAVPCVAFSPDSTHVVSVGADNDHTMKVHTVDGGDLVGTVKTGTDRIIGVAWNPHTGYITTVGVKTCTFWKFNGRGFDRPKKGLVGSKGKRCTQLAVAFTPRGRTWTGTATGEVYIWSGNKLAKTVRAHKGRVSAIAASDECMITGGLDGKIQFWNTRGANLGSLNVGSAVRALSFSLDGRIACGTAKGEVLDVDVSLESLDTAKVTTLHRGHYDGETWALSPNYDGDRAVTGGDDNLICVWDLTSHEIVTSRIIAEKADKKAVARSRKGGRQSTMSSCAPNQCCRAADWGPTGTIAIGTNDGRVLVLDEEDLSTIAEKQVSSKPISVVRFDPTGDFLAIGAHDSKAYIYSVAEGELEKVSVCRGNSSYITHIDWDTSGVAIQTTSGAYELLFYTAESGDQETGGATLFRDEPWETFTCTLGWPVQGIWPKRSKGSDINTLDRSPEKDLLAVGDDSGRIRLFKYPCLDNSAKCHVKRGHASHLTNIRFTADGETLLSVGGNDNTLIEWAVL